MLKLDGKTLLITAKGGGVGQIDPN